MVDEKKGLYGVDIYSGIFNLCKVHQLGRVEHTLDELKHKFIIELQKPKSEQQSIAELKDIKNIVGETTWEYVQRF